MSAPMIGGPWVYPRVCGGTWCWEGSLDAKMGSIPACAGEPRVEADRLRLCGVYPRVCGGTSNTGSALTQSVGLSPRVRGEPTEPCPKAKCGRVYPRVCGGTRVGMLVFPLAPGLSPRVRGNPAQQGHGCERVRSIPACAGEPRHVSRRGSSTGVYPRVCGGTPTTGRR